MNQKKKYITKFTTIITAIVLCCTLMVPIEFAYAAQNEQTAESSANSWRYKDGQNCAEEDVPELKQMRGKTPAPWSEVDGKFYSSNGKVITGAIAKGIDVSYWNGNETPIDWEKVKASGIDYAILRCGYGNNLKKYDDSTFAYNASECERLGIPYGVYIYSYADSVSDAKSEANHVLRLITKRKIDYPVYYDLEDEILTQNMTNSEIVECAKVFCERINDHGYVAGIYANLNWWNNILKSSKLDKYEKWVAQYNYKCDYKKKYRIWQSTSMGTIDGIATKGKVDVNFELDLDDDKYAAAGTFLPLEKGWHTTKTGRKYYIGSSGKRVTGYQKIGSYYYLFNSYGMMNTGTVKSDDRQYVLGTSGRSTLYTAKTKDALNYRTGPSTSYKVKGTFKKGTTINIIREKNGWGKARNGYWVKLNYTKKLTTYPKFISFKVKTTDELNYRTGPGTSYTKKGVYSKGTILNIVNKKNGWGKTKSGYWVKLEYTKRI